MGKDIVSEIEDLVSEMRVEYTKFMDGNASAGARVRKAAQAIKAKCQDLRVTVQNIKKERSAE